MTLLSRESQAVVGAFLQDLVAWMEQDLGVIFAMPSQANGTVSFHFHDEDGACLPPFGPYPGLGAAILAALEIAWRSADDEAATGYELAEAMSGAGLLVSADGVGSWRYDWQDGPGGSGFASEADAVRAALLRCRPGAETPRLLIA